MRRRSFLIIGLISIAAVGAGLLLAGHSNNKPDTSNMSYISYMGNYVFKIPNNYSVDEKTIPDSQLIYPSSQQLNVKTIDEAYGAGVISVQSLNLSDNSNEAFKKYVNDNFAADMRKLSPDTKVSYKDNGKWGFAKITTKKAGKVARFAYLVNGKHPVAIVGLNESAPLKAIELSIGDIEDSGLNNQQKQIRYAIDGVLLYIKVNKAQDLYNNASSDLRAKNSLNDVSSALNSLKLRLTNTITFYGVVYTDQTCSVGLNFWDPKNQAAPPVYGSLVFTKEGSSWRLQQMSLPPA